MPSWNLIVWARETTDAAAKLPPSKAAEMRSMTGCEAALQAKIMKETVAYQGFWRRLYSIPTCPKDGSI